MRRSKYHRNKKAVAGSELESLRSRGDTSPPLEEEITSPPSSSKKRDVLNQSQMIPQQAIEKIMEMPENLEMTNKK